MMNLYPFMMMPVYNLPNEQFFRPPLLVDLLNSLVNFNKPENEKVKLSEIPAAATNLVFDFTYPLSTHVNKQEFETMILKKFFMRRIGYETYTPWKMQLDVKLNEIMPVYNKLFDSMYNWNLFNDGESYTRTITTEKENEQTSSTTTSASNTVNNTRKFSNLPQNEINDIENNSYMTDYTKENNSGTSTGTGSGSGSGSESSDTTETYNKDVSNKIEIYNKFLEDRNHIMSLIFKDLDSLFYGLSNFN